MGISISSAFATASLAVGNVSSTASAQPIRQSANTSGDVVELTEAQQVYQLYNQGQSISQIASGLSLTVETVNNYLGIGATG